MGGLRCAAPRVSIATIHSGIKHLAEGIWRGRAIGLADAKRGFWWRMWRDACVLQLAGTCIGLGEVYWVGRFLRWPVLMCV
jgi:hypothetical protein